MSKRNNQQQIWADKQFIEKLEKIRSKRVLANKPPIKSLGDLTQLITQCENFHKLEEEIINLDLNNQRKRKKFNLYIKLDGGLY